MKTPPKALVLVDDRDGGQCIRCGVYLFGLPWSRHHRLPRRMGGTRDVRSYDPRNLVTVCGSGSSPHCHNAIESNRSLAYDTGWLIRSYDELDLPLITLDGRAVYLKADGGRTEVVDAASLLAAAAMA